MYLWKSVVELSFTLKLQKLNLTRKELEVPKSCCCYIQNQINSVTFSVLMSQQGDEEMIGSFWKKKKKKIL